MQTGPMQMQQMQQQQQIHLHQQQQARQALMAQQLHNGMGGVNGMPMGMNMAQMNPAQIQAMRQRMGPVSVMCRPRCIPDVEDYWGSQANRVLS